MVNLGPLMAEICWWVCDAWANFNRFQVLGSLLHRCRSTEVNQTLHVVWPSPWMVHLYIHFWGLLPPSRILPDATFTLRPSLAFCYIGSVTAQYFSSRCQPNFAAFSSGCHLYSAGQPLRWASAHILVGYSLTAWQDGTKLTGSLLVEGVKYFTR